MFPFFHLTATQLLVYTLVATHITIVGVTVFLHRCQAHKSVKLSPLVSHFFRFWLWLTTGMITKEWVAVHRKHHAKCETADDPHSPVFHGVWKVLSIGVWLYRLETQIPETMEVYGQGTPSDWMERNVYTKHNLLGVVSLLILETMCFGFPGILIWAVQMAWIPFWAAGVINGIGHWFGYRNFASNDNARNIIPIGIWIGGEEFHNNHHAFPRSAKLSFKKWEFDIGWFYIRLMEIAGLAKVLEVSPRCEQSFDKFSIASTPELFSIKMRSLYLYERDVMQSVVVSECDNVTLNKVCTSLYGKFKQWWLLDASLLTKEANDYLQKILSEKELLHMVYELRSKLIEAWQGIGFSTQERVKLLESWCRNAEKLGLESLDRFVLYLRQKMPVCQ